MLYAARRHMVSMQITHTVNTRDRIRFMLSICFSLNSATESVSTVRPMSPVSVSEHLVVEHMEVLSSISSTDFKRQRQRKSKMP